MRSVGKWDGYTDFFFRNTQQKTIIPVLWQKLEVQGGKFGLCGVGVFQSEAIYCFFQFYFWSLPT